MTRPLLLLIATVAFFVEAAATASEIVFQYGRVLTTLQGTSRVYDATYETSITTQYIDTWNNNNGKLHY
jgi:hypothetical protein